MKIKIFLISSLFISTLSSHSQQVAFPGAEGFGAYATGGRGGSVYEVTNLNNSGAGSLRDAVSQGHRTVVFRVSGDIELHSALKIAGNITIAGQTAPGDGICVRDYPTIVDGYNVIIRYMRFRLGDKHGLKSDAFNINAEKNVILDHCSISWGGDECASWYGNENVTIQWCIIGEGLDYLGHSMGGLWGGQSTYHHNLIHTCGSRHPKFAYTYDGDITDHRNNVIYNWDYESAYCSPTGRVNIVANYYKSGPATNVSVKSRIVYSEYSTKRLHVADNYVVGYPGITADNWSGGVHGQYIRHDDAFPAPVISQQDAETAYQLVLDRAGASIVRDSVDVRVINNVMNNTGQIIDRPSDVGGWPVLVSLDPPVDTDHDGMPDAYETENQLDMNNPDDRNDDANNDGFTNLEDYLNSLVPYDYEALGGDTILPVAPSNLATTTFSGNQIDLTWTDNADNERGFRIQYSSDHWQTYNEKTVALANITGNSITGLEGTIRYEFRVAAYNTTGNSGFSNTATDSTITDNHFFLRTEIEGPGRILVEPDSSHFEAGSIVTITAVADTGYIFDTWLEDVTGTENPKIITMTTSILVKARFIREAFVDAPRYYDFGPGPVEPGYQKITIGTSAYSVGTGFGFENINGLDQRDRSAPDNLRRDFVVSTILRTFIVDCPNDVYHIQVIAGDNMSSAPNGPMDVFAEGVEKISNMYSDGGAFDQQDFTVEVTDGQLNLDMVHSNNPGDGVWRINALEIVSTTSDISDDNQITPFMFELAQNYPNPFNSKTTIHYTLPKDMKVKLAVYDMLGREVAVLVVGEKRYGAYTVIFDAGDIASGIYCYRLKTNDRVMSRKFVYIK